MIEFDASLQAILATAISKTDWANKVVAGLGSSRTVIGKWAASSVDVFGSGTTFFDADLSGAMTALSGNFVTFGSISNARTRGRRI